MTIRLTAMGGEQPTRATTWQGARLAHLRAPAPERPHELSSPRAEGLTIEEKKNPRQAPAKSIF